VLLLATVQLNGNRIEIENSHLESIVQITRDYQKNMTWLIEHYDKLRSQFPDEYVGVYDQKLIEHAKKLNDLLEYIVNQCTIDIRSVAIRKLSKQTEQLFLTSLAL
jgi:hypothetical protein